MFYSPNFAWKNTAMNRYGALFFSFRIWTRNGTFVSGTKSKYKRKTFCFDTLTTSVLQPVDKGVMHSVKAAYHTHVKQLLFDIENTQELKMDTSFPVRVWASIWQQPNTGAIVNCFRKAIFQRNGDTTWE